MTPHGLGRGLSALIPGAPAPSRSVESDERGAILVPPERIHLNPRQPRREFRAEDLASLAESLRTHGVLQPLVVRRQQGGDYELIAGERRLRAARLAGLAAVPIVVRSGVEADVEKLTLALVENLQREDLNPMDRALAFRGLQDELGCTQEEIARRVGVSRTSIAHSLRFLALPEDIQAALRDGRLSEGHAKVLAGIADSAEQRRWFARILGERLSVAAVSAGTEGRGVRRTRIASRSSIAAGGDPNLRAKELALQRTLGAKVRITPTAHGGTITITYTNAEELTGILRAICG